MKFIILHCLVPFLFPSEPSYTEEGYTLTSMSAFRQAPHILKVTDCFVATLLEQTYTHCRMTMGIQVSFLPENMRAFRKGGMPVYCIGSIRSFLMTTFTPSKVNAT